MPIGKLKTEADLLRFVVSQLPDHGNTIQTLQEYASHEKFGVGDPEGAVVGDVGDRYRRLDGGAATSLYVKESGSGTNTGWVGK